MGAGARRRWVVVGAGVLLLVAGAAGGALRLGAPGAWIGLRWVGLACVGLACAARRRLTPWIFWAMLAGIELGFDAPRAALQMHVLGEIFLRLIKTIVAPLIFSKLVTGIAGHGDLKAVGRMGWKSLLYFEVLTTLALVIGLVAINLSHAGAGLAMPQAVQAAAPVDAEMHWETFVLHIFPENIATAVAEGQILQVAVFAVLFGVALARVPQALREPMLRVVGSLGEVMFRLTNLVMYFAPVAVGAALAVVVARQGGGVLVSMGRLLLTFYGALVVFFGAVLLPTALLFRVPLRRFCVAVAEPATIAFATAASEAALPRAMEQMEALGVPRRVVSFVIPAGYSFNLDGSTLYLAVGALFVAQADGVHLSLGQQITMMLTLVLTSKGVAGVPRAVLVVLLGTAATFHLGTEPIFVMLGIDAVMDMGRTATNVVGNCLASVAVARWEGVFGEERASEAVQEGAES